MNENKNQTLVLRLPSAIEKSDTGAKRVLSGMVADTLALVRKNEIPKPRIVILDDTPEIRMILVETLVMFGAAELVEFGDGHEAWQELSRNLPDLLITDINHPGLACEEMFRRLQERKANLSILVLSGSGYREELKARLGQWPELSITFLPKPFTPSGLLEEICTKLPYFRDPQQ